MWHLGKMRHLDWFQIEMMQVPKSRANLKQGAWSSKTYSEGVNISWHRKSVSNLTLLLHKLLKEEILLSSLIMSYWPVRTIQLICAFMQHGMNKTNKFSDLSVLYRQMPAEKGGGGGLKSILWNLASAPPPICFIHYWYIFDEFTSFSF